MIKIIITFQPFVQLITNSRIRS